MKIYIGVPTLTRFDLLDRLLQSIKNQTLQPDGMFIVDNSNGNLSEEDLEYIDNTTVIEVPNMGVARSWNEMILRVEDEDVILITNDDNVLEPYAVEMIYDLALDNPEHNYFGSLTGGFSCFAVRGKALVDVGKFDETFYPAYFEDNDYHYRMKLQDIDFICTKEEIYKLGVDGQASQTVNSDMTNSETKEIIRSGYIANQAYYKAKWGGGPGEEKYKKPFNL